MLSWALAACGTGASGPGRSTADLRPGTVWVIGLAANTKLGATIMTPEGPVRCQDRSTWSASEVGAPVVVEGTLSTIRHDDALVSETGERSSGVAGVERLVTPSSPPSTKDDGQLAAEEALFAAIARRDRAAIEAAIAPDVALHIEGAPPTLTRGQLIDAILATPGEITGVHGEDLVAHTSPSRAIVRGVQIVSRTGEPDDRTRFLDVFVRRDGRWVIVEIFAS